jgi:hypothetical protein
VERVIRVRDGVFQLWGTNQGKVKVALKHLGKAEQEMVRDISSSKLKEMGVKANSEGFKGLAMPNEVDHTALTASAVSANTIIPNVKAVDEIVGPGAKGHMKKKPTFELRRSVFQSSLDGLQVRLN